MNYEKYLEKYQEIPYKIFKNSLSKNSLFHAYLFVGETGTPLKELAMYFASCILNNNGDFAKEDDPILKNVFKNNYPNFVVLMILENLNIIFLKPHLLLILEKFILLMKLTI